MSPDSIRITAQMTRNIDSAEEEKLSELYESGEKVCGLIDQFCWMPFIVTGREEEGAAVTFDLLMVSK